MLKSFNILLCLTFLISNLTYASNKSIKLDYENVLVKKHQFINNKEISIINGYGMCALPTQYPCEITVNQVDKLLLSFKSSNQIELTYIQTNHISNENQLTSSKIIIQKTYSYQIPETIIRFKLPEIETTKHLNDSGETQIEVRIDKVKN